MAAKESQEMKKARKLIERGSTPAAAAKAVGITRQAIYMSRWYRERQDNAKRSYEQM